MHVGPTNNSLPFTFVRSKYGSRSKKRLLDSIQPICKKRPRVSGKQGHKQQEQGAPIGNSKVRCRSWSNHQKHSNYQKILFLGKTPTTQGDETILLGDNTKSCILQRSRKPLDVCNIIQQMCVDTLQRVRGEANHHICRQQSVKSKSKETEDGTLDIGKQKQI